MKQLLTAAVLLLCAGIVACSSADPKAEIQAQEAELQKVMSDEANSSPDAISTVHKSLIAAYESFTADPKNSLDSEEYFRLAELYESVGQYNKTISTLETLRTKHPESKRAGDALFKVGFIYHNNLGDLVKAEDTYRKFINKYPDHHFRDDAEVEIKYLGVSPEEFLEQRRKELAADSANVAQ
ncbi:MAG: tol-pal system YbgF family protein [Bacteroidia bacterium]